MSRTIDLEASRRVRRWWRARELARARRAGAHARRHVRAEQIAWLHRAWQLVLATVLVVCLCIAACLLVLPDPLAPYVVGFLIASFGWWLYMAMMQSAGLSNQSNGIQAEEWTADELRPLRAAGWRLVNHVMLEFDDVDHALLGRGGFFAIDTKYRTDWTFSERELPALALSARNDAKSLRGRLGLPTHDVRPLVVMWGPHVRSRHDRTFEFDRVTFCPGHRLREFIDQQNQIIDDGAIATAYEHLDRYVQNREPAEVAKQGPIPRALSESINDIIWIAGTTVGAATLILAPIGVRPAGIWSIATAIVASATAVAIRLRTRAYVRLQRMCVALVTTSIGLATSVGVSLVVDHLRR